MHIGLDGGFTLDGYGQVERDIPAKAESLVAGKRNSGSGGNKLAWRTAMHSNGTERRLPTEQPGSSFEEIRRSCDGT